MASTNTSETLLTRVESLVSDNRKAIIAGAAFAVAAGGVGYYLYTARTASASLPDVEKGPEGKKKKKASKKKRVGEEGGPLLEERKPKSKPSDTASETSGMHAYLKHVRMSILLTVSLLQKQRMHRSSLQLKLSRYPRRFVRVNILGQSTV